GRGAVLSVLEEHPTNRLGAPWTLRGPRILPSGHRGMGFAVVRPAAEGATGPARPAAPPVRSISTPGDDPMSRRTKAERNHLTDYEAKQVRRIAAWKSEPPNPLVQLWSTLTGPGAKAVEKIIPDRLIKMTIERLDDAAALMAGREDIKRRAGVQDLAELRD